MKFIILILSVVVITATSCNNSNIENGSSHSLNIEYDSLVCEADSLSLSFYSVFSVNNDEGVFIGYNSHLHSLDMFSLERSQFIKRENLNSNGPSAIPVVKSLYYHNSDSLFLFCPTQVVQLTNEFKIKTKYNLVRAKGMIDNNIGQVSSSSFGKFFFYSPTKELILSSNLFEDKISKPIIAAYNLRLDSIYFLPIYFPQDDFKNGGYGLLKQLNYSNFNDTVLYYGFAYAPGIYIYNLTDGTSSHYPVNPKIATKAKPIRTEEPVFAEMNDHAIKNPMYFEPLVTSKYIVQIYQPGQNLKNETGNFNSFKDKTWSMLIYSKNGVFLENIPIGVKQLYRNSWFVYKGEIYFCPHPFRFVGTPPDMTSLIFYKINIK